MIRQLSLILLAGTALAAASAANAGTQLFDTSSSLTVATQGTSKGAGQTEGQGQITATFEGGKNGWYVGVKAFNITTSQGGNFEHHMYAGKKGKIGAYSYNIYLLNRVQEGTVASYDNDMVELDATLSRKFGNTTIKGRVILTPDGFGTAEQQQWYEVGAAYQLTGKVVLSANVATRQTDVGSDYEAWNLGAAYSLTDKTVLDLRWYDTNAHDLGDRYEGRLIGSISQKF